MGSCISKCNQKPPSPSPKQISHVQDKLVISPPPKDPPIFPSINSPHPHSPSSSCNTSVSSSSCAFSKSPLSSTCSSSISNSSNDFLWSYGKENPHYSVKSSPVKLASVNVPPPSKYTAVPLTSKQRTNVPSSTPNKRSRSNSPVLTRQKSYRKEAERPHQVINVLSTRNSGSSSPSRVFRSGISEHERSHVRTNPIPRRTLVSSDPNRPYTKSCSAQGRNLVSSSPSRRFHTDNLQPDRLPQRNLSSSSPSRRFNSDPCREVTKNGHMESCHNQIPSKRNVTSKQSPARNKENICTSPWNSSMSKTETCTHRIDPGTDTNAVNQDQDSLPMDDIDNPLIALDCFIFL